MCEWILLYINVSELRTNDQGLINHKLENMHNLLNSRNLKVKARSLTWPHFGYDYFLLHLFRSFIFVLPNFNAFNSSRQLKGHLVRFILRNKLHFWNETIDTPSYTITIPKFRHSWITNIHHDRFITYSQNSFSVFSFPEKWLASIISWFYPKC
jgi:hypothetical protein